MPTLMSQPNSRAAPDSTTIMLLNEMISQFDLDAPTLRSTTLDPGKL